MARQPALPHLPLRIGLVVLALGVPGCAEQGPSRRQAAATTTSTTSTTTSNTATSATAAPVTIPPRAATPTTGAPTPAQSKPTSAPARATVHAIDAPTASRMSSSWREGCPVPLDQLRLVKVVHWGFDGAEHGGELVVHASSAGGMARTFDQLLADRFPIQQVRLVDEYGADDDRSMAANNTSAFNCRRVAGSTSWSEHAYGRAIDVNPVQNPYVTKSGSVSPPAGSAYTDRSNKRPGMITAGDATVAAFARIGWRWGGYWSSAKDYQHFSSTGR